MFSDFIHVIEQILNLPPATFLALLPFVLVFWFLGKIFRALVLEGHWVILSGTALCCYAITQAFWNDGQYVLSLPLLIVLFIMGIEGYRRLTLAG